MKCVYGTFDLGVFVQNKLINGAMTSLHHITTPLAIIISKIFLYCAVRQIITITFVALGPTNLKTPAF